MGLYEEMEQLLKEEPLDLIHAATLLGRLGPSPSEVRPVSEELDRIGAEVRDRLQDAPPDEDPLQVLNRYLFDDFGLRGNEDDYYDPRNSFLGEVLGRKTGLPITLSLVYIEAGRRAGLRLAGVGFPGHFLVRFESEGGPRFVDPFHAGRVLEEEDLKGLLRERSGQEIPLDPAFLRPASEREILTRMLHNLKGLYMTSEEFEKLLQVLDLLLLLDPQTSLDLRDRGLVHYELGEFPKARNDLLAYLELDPSAGDAEVIQEHLNDIESRLRMFR
ncbi:MAG: SirB1 family protein [Thermoplasmata archaeon]